MSCRVDHDRDDSGHQSNSHQGRSCSDLVGISEDDRGSDKNNRRDSRDQDHNAGMPTAARLLTGDEEASTAVHPRFIYGGGSMGTREGRPHCRRRTEMPVELTTDVGKQLDALVDRLADEFGDRVPVRQVTETVRQVRAEFGSPPITQFLPILVERQARSRISG
jgi:hypothetical protein